MLRRKKGIRVKQHDITDCGAACLASVCAYYGLQFPVARIRQYAFTDQKGTNILGMVEAANRLGLSAKGVRAEYEALYVVPKPMIAHIVVKERLQHFVVIYKATEDYVEYMDPGDGQMHRRTTEEFEKEWTGVLILMKDTYQSLYGSILTQGGIQFVSTGITIAILWLGSVLVIDQELTPGTLMVFYSLVGYVISPIGSLISSNQSIQDALIAADRLFQIMDLEREQEEEGKMELTSERVGNIVFEDVCFRYGSRKEVFSHLNLEIEKGKMTAIVGESGSGKTTLMSLLQHIYKVQSGHIRIGAYDIADIANQSLRQRIGVVPQQVELFSGSILENIAVGELRPDKARVNALVDRLGLREFIDNQPKGIKSQIGEHGVNLSGGERQRLAVARALYRNPDIVILDEATSSLDNIAERHVKEVMEQLKQEGKTVIVIAHRLSTVKTADRIVVLQQGRVQEEGTHEELTEADGLYRKLWKEQFDILD